MEEVQKLVQKKGGRELYKKAIVANLVNVGIFGVLTYWISVTFACVPGPLTLSEQIRGVFGILFIEGLGFYLVHKAFHEIKWLYPAHSFHHRFNDVILPSTASAVSATEFLLAYMFPIFLSCAIVPNDRTSAVIASGIIGITNLLIHSPFMVGTKLHWILVSPDDHFRHHKVLTTDYGAPVVSFDRLLSVGASKA